MSDEKDDLELDALQRQLDDAFATTRPRRDFEDELWLRMQARRPFASRVRDAFSGLVAGFREAPAIPLGAVALVLIVAVGIGVIASGGLHPNQNATSGAFSQAAPDLAAGEFGRLPTPRLDPAAVDKSSPLALAAGPQPPGPAFGPGTPNLYFGPANLRWSGQLPAFVQAPVYRYAEPSANDADQFAGSLGAAKSSQANPVSAALGEYSGQGFDLAVRPSIPQLPLEPTFVLRMTGTSPNNAGADSRGVASSFLDRFSLTPQWPSTVAVEQISGVTQVVYQRAFTLPGGGMAHLIDWNGERYGIAVEVSDGMVGACVGPLPLSLNSADYRLMSGDQAVRLALGAAPASSRGISPEPTVNLTDVQLVYALAVANGQGFYEPAYLFSGTFQYNGQTYTKRVLVPLVDPSQRT